MLENGSRESFMVQAFICTRMENTMKVNLEMVKRVERENFISSTKMFMKVIGLMINSNSQHIFFFLDIDKLIFRKKKKFFNLLSNLHKKIIIEMVLVYILTIKDN